MEPCRDFKRARPHLPSSHIFSSPAHHAASLKVLKVTRRRAVGSAVCAFGLSGHKDVNDRTGVIMAFDAAKGRYAVASETGEAALIKPTNLCPVMNFCPKP